MTTTTSKENDAKAGFSREHLPAPTSWLSSAEPCARAAGDEVLLRVTRGLPGGMMDLTTLLSTSDHLQVQRGLATALEGVWGGTWQVFYLRLPTTLEWGFDLVYYDEEGQKRRGSGKVQEARLIDHDAWIQDVVMTAIMQVAELTVNSRPQ